MLIAATALKTMRLVESGLPRDARAGFAAGSLASLISTLAARRLGASLEAGGSHLPLGLYRIALGALSYRRLRGRGDMRLNAPHG
ncbi:MAG: hypothetical protein NVS2B6_20530 [Thermoleophilaceae bacterium]